MWLIGVFIGERISKFGTMSPYTRPARADDYVGALISLIPLLFLYHFATFMNIPMVWDMGKNSIDSKISKNTCRIKLILFSENMSNSIWVLKKKKVTVGA